MIEYRPKYDIIGSHFITLHKNKIPITKEILFKLHINGEVWKKMKAFLYGPLPPICICCMNL